MLPDGSDAIMHEEEIMKKKETLFDGKVLLIPGGTGSFGNAVAKRFLTTGIKEIRILSRDEKKQDDMIFLTVLFWLSSAYQTE